MTILLILLLLWIAPIAVTLFALVKNKEDNNQWIAMALLTSVVPVLNLLTCFPLLVHYQTIKNLSLEMSKENKL